MEFMADTVLDEKKLKIKNPHNMYTGKLSISVPKSVENTNVNMIICSKGFSRLHKIPKKDPLYFFFTSFLTNKYKRYEYL